MLGVEYRPVGCLGMAFEVNQAAGGDFGEGGSGRGRGG